MKTVLLLISLLVAFFAGSYWEKWKLLNSGPVVSSKPLKLQNSPEKIGELPEGTVLYSYSSDYGVETFVVFINTKNLDVLNKHEFDKASTLAPIDGYVE